MSLGDRMSYPRLYTSDHLFGGGTGTTFGRLNSPSRLQPSTMRSAGCASPAPPQFFVDPPASPDKAPHTPGSSTDGWKSETQDSFATPAGTSPVKRHNDRYYVDMSGVGTASNRSLPTAPVGKTGKGLGNQTHLQVPVSPFYRFCH